MASLSSAPPSNRKRVPVPAPDTFYLDYLKALPQGQLVELDLIQDAEPPGEDQESDQNLFTVMKVGADAWRLRDMWVDRGGGRNDITTEVLFDLVREKLKGQSSIVVAHGKDPRVVKREGVDQGRDAEEPRFFSMGETIELNSDDDEEKLSVTEMVKREGKSLYEAVRPLHMHMQMDLLHLLGFGPVFLCNNRSHLASMIAQKYRTKIEKVAPGFALTAVHVHRHMHIHVHVHMHHVHACPLVVLAGPTFAHCPEHLLVPSTFGITVGLTLAFQLALALALAGQGRDDLDPNPNPNPDLDLNPNSDLNHR